MYRKPVFAGTWYEKDQDNLEGYIHSQVSKEPGHWAVSPKVLIMPHAGHRFSGQLAARAAAQLQPGPERVVIFGPSHQHGFRGVALPGSEGYETPLGKMPLDRDKSLVARAFHEVIEEPLAHAQEHSLEVILPFIQHRLGSIPVLPLVVGQIEKKRLQALIAALWGGPETLIVISTDLTHFLTGDQASTIDVQTAKKIEKADSAGLTGKEACGFKALSALLDEANKRGMRLTRLGLMNSGHVTGDRDRVVGYGAWAGHELKDAKLSLTLRKELLKYARKGLELRLVNGKDPEVKLGSFAVPLEGLGASFVTLTLEGRLRGCIGSLAAHQPLVADVIKNAVKAGFYDPRFTPVTKAELEACEIEIAILSRPVAMSFDSEQDLLSQLIPGEDGLILTEGNKRGTFLPKVWESLPTPKQFVSNLKRKAGLPEDYWSESVTISRYTTEKFNSGE